MEIITYNYATITTIIFLEVKNKIKILSLTNSNAKLGGGKK
jgi:hypothetical protein